MIDDQVITEARRRLRNAARNEQTSVALNELLRLAEQENKRLREENESQRFDILAMNQSLDLLREENERLRKDAVENRTDADRWRFFRSAGNDVTLRMHNSRSDFRDEAIDAARGNK